MLQRLTLLAACVLYLCVVTWGYLEVTIGFWNAFRLVTPVSEFELFSFSDYLTTLALLLLVITTSDFRHRYRLNNSRLNWAKTGFWSAAVIGALLLAVELWYGSKWPVLSFAQSVAVPKATLGAAFLAITFLALWVAFFRYPRLTKGNAERFVQYHFHLVHAGDAERSRVMASELVPALPQIVRSAARPYENARPDPAALAARQFLSLIGDRRFCRLVATEVPGFALTAFAEAQRLNAGTSLPIFQFARNVGQELIRNTNSVFYQESSGFDSGLLGFQRETTRIVFGNYAFVEQCATDGESPLDTDYRDFAEFSEAQMQGYFRAAEVFLKDYLRVTKGRRHSYALVRILNNFESIGSRLYRLRDKEDLQSTTEYPQLQAGAHFLRQAIGLIEKHAAPNRSVKFPEQLWDYTAQDDIAACIAKLAISSGNVSSPDWTTWSVQHNTIWNICSFGDGAAHKLIRAKIRRKLFDEIKEMDEFANFQGACAVGFCLNVLGLTPVRRGDQSEWYPLQAMALKWTRANYLRLLRDHPKVAAACLHGAVTYDPEGQRLVKEFNNDTGKERPREYLQLVPAPTARKAHRKARPRTVNPASS